MSIEKDDPVNITIASYGEAFEEFTDKTRSVESFPGLKEELDKFIELLPDMLTSQLRVADIGFGSGRDIIFFKNRGLKTVGIERTMNFIISLKKVIKEPLLCMDMRKVGLCPEFLDGIWCCAALLHLPLYEADMALSEFYRLLKSKGILYVSVKEGEGEEWLREGHINTPRFFRYYSLKTISAMIEEHGFTILYSQIKPHKAGKHGWISIYAQKA